MVHQFTILFKEFQEVIQFQVRETDIDTIRILLVVKPEYNHEIQEIIFEKIDHYSKKQACVSIDIVEEIPLERGNKRRFVIGRG
jgi:phenylacetate-CoA ligase